MKIISSNVQGLNDMGKLHTVLSKARKYDIALLQETKMPRRKIGMLRNKWAHHEGVFCAPAPDERSRRGVITLFSPHFRVVHLESVEDMNGQFLMNVVRVEEKNFLIINYYGDPDVDVDAQMTVIRCQDRVEEIQRRHQIHSIICGGDFNFTIYPQLDSNSTSRKRRAEDQWLTFIEEQELYDPEDIAGNNHRHTYFRHNAEHCSARYDRYYVSRDLTQTAKVELEVRTGDHTPIRLEVMENRRPKGQWCMNDSLLNTVKGMTTLHETIAEMLRPLANDNNGELSIRQLQEFIQYEEVDAMDLLTKLVEKVRLKMKEIQSENRKTVEEKEKDLFNTLLETRDERNRNDNDETRERFEEAREKIRVHQAEITGKAMERNFYQFTRAGERMTRYHFSRMVKKHESRDISKLRTQDGNIITGEDIAKHMAEKFGQLALEDPNIGDITIEEYLGHIADNTKKCPEDLKEMLEADITVDELEEAIKKTKNHSTPGPLGISNLLLKALFPLIKVILAEATNKLLFSDEQTEIPKWLFHRKVVFIHKPGRPPQSDDSYRGLSMLENIFKAMSSVIAKRMAEVLLQIQSPHQYGFTEGRSCMEATRGVIDCINYARIEQKPLIVISTDIFKAFDSVSHKHMEKCLEFYEFPEKFIKATMKLVRNGTMQFEVNGHLSDECELQKGTGQGDPKSSYLYNLAVTPLIEYLVNSPEVPRFEIGEKSMPPSCFADDNITMLKGDNADVIIQVMEKVAEFERVSGLQLNFSKCEFLAVNCEDNIVNQISQRTGMVHVRKIKHLGVIINERGEVTEEDNIQPIIEKMEGISERYSTSTSTPIGRGLYGKYLLGSLYIHRLQNAQLTEPKIKELHKAILDMTWTRARMQEPYRSYRVHIAKARVNQPVEYGGMSIPNPSNQMKVIRMSWIRKFTEDHQVQGWCIILEQWLSELRRPPLQQHMWIGPKEWRKTARKMEEKSDFWAEVFRMGENIQEMTLKVDKQWHMTPVIGSAEGDDAAMLTSLEYANPIARPIFRTRLRTVGQLFKVDRVGRIRSDAMKTLDEVRQEFGFMDAMLWNSVLGLINTIKARFRAVIMTEPAMQTQITNLESIVFKYKKGCSEANRLILEIERNRWSHGPVPKSYSSYRRDGITNIEAKEFKEAFKIVTNTDLRVPVQWTSFQILLRTLWTRVKEANTNRDADGEECLNCGLEAEHTVHLMVTCQFARGVIAVLSNVINENREEEVQLNSDKILFHVKGENVNEEEERDIDDILLIYKYMIYKTRFRENLERMPTVRFGVVTIILELIKYVNFKKVEGKSSHRIESYIKSLRKEINWDI